MKPKTPTAAQLLVLAWLNEKPGRALYGPMGEERFASAGSGRWGCAGGGLDFSKSTARAIRAAGWLTWDHDRYPLGYYGLSPAGLAALNRTKGEQ